MPHPDSLHPLYSTLALGSIPSPPHASGKSGTAATCSPSQHAAQGTSTGTPPICPPGVTLATHLALGSNQVCAVDAQLAAGSLHSLSLFCSFCWLAGGLSWASLGLVSSSQWLPPLLAVLTITRLASVAMTWYLALIYLLSSAGCSKMLNHSAWVNHMACSPCSHFSYMGYMGCRLF